MIVVLTYEYEKGRGRAVMIVIGDDEREEPCLAREFPDLATAQDFIREALAVIGRRQKALKGRDVAGLLRELNDVATQHGGVVPQEEEATA